MIYKFIKCAYLVIDDFLKRATKRAEAKETDLQLVFEIIDYRYRYKKPVIISSEYFLDEISDRTESIAGRLKQMATHFEDNYIIEIDRDKTRNFRLKGVQRI
jgi:DNA replication protein DnaC